MKGAPLKISKHGAALAAKIVAQRVLAVRDAASIAKDESLAVELDPELGDVCLQNGKRAVAESAADGSTTIAASPRYSKGSPEVPRPPCQDGR